jgi:hypothetical protein
MITKWKDYLKSKNLYHGDTKSQEMDLQFKIAMISLEKSISDKVSSVKGMIWYDNNINSNASINDVEQATQLLALGQAPFDAGDIPAPSLNDLPPTVPFISQDAANQDEWNPKTNQNNGTWQNPAPKSNNFPGKKQSPKQKKYNEKPTNLQLELDNLANLINLEK